MRFLERWIDQPFPPWCAYVAKCARTRRAICRSPCALADAFMRLPFLDVSQVPNFGCACSNLASIDHETVAMSESISKARLTASQVAVAHQRAASQFDQLVRVYIIRHDVT